MKQSVFSLFAFLISFSFVFSSCNKEDDVLVTPTDESYSFTYNGKNYVLVKEAMSWQNAVSHAVADGGYLAEINSAEEQAALFNELTSLANITFDETNNQFGFAAVWLGGNDLETEGTWVWNGNNDETKVQFWNGGVDGNAVNGLYNNWGIEPDNNGDQDFLCMGLETTPINAAGKWTDLGGTNNSLFFLIEYD